VASIAFFVTEDKDLGLSLAQPQDRIDARLPFADT
jgi:hypothetical protein